MSHKSYLAVRAIIHLYVYVQRHLPAGLHLRSKLVVGLALLCHLSALQADQTDSTTPHAPRTPFSKSVELVQSIECDFRGHSRTRTEAIAGDRRLHVTFANSVAPPTLLQKTFAHVDGYQVEDQLEIDSFQLDPPNQTLLPPKVALKEHRGLLIFLNFSDLDYDPALRKAFTEEMVKVEAFFSRSSRGRMTLKTTIVPESISIPLSAATPITSRIASLALLQVETHHPELFKNTYDHYIYAIPYLSTLSWAGLAERTGANIWMNGQWSWSCLAHELGHNLGLPHAHALAPITPNPIGPGYDIEYGDLFDIMGNNWSAIDYSAAHKARLGWLSPEEITQVAQPGVYRLFRHDHAKASGLQHLTVGYGLSDYYALEYRQDSLNPGTLSGIEIRRGYRNELTGATLETELLDMSPLSDGGWLDSPLPLGATFSDAAQEIKITPLTSGGDSPHEYVDVKIEAPEYIPRLVISSLQHGQSLTLYQPVVIQSRTSLNAEHIRRAELWVNGSYVTESTKQPFELPWVPPTLGTQTIGVRTFDIYGRPAEPSSLGITVHWDSEPQKTSLPGLHVSHLTSGKGRWVGWANGALSFSTNLTDWTAGSGFDSSGRSVQALAFSGGAFVVAGSKGLLGASEDGIHWSAVERGHETWNAVEFSRDKWFAVGTHGAMAVTRDLQNWTQLPSLVTSDILQIAAGPQGLMAVTADAQVLTLAPGSEPSAWTLQSLPGCVRARLALWDGGRFVVAGSDGRDDRLYFSVDTKTWTSNKVASTGDPILNAMATLKNFLFTIGSSVNYQRPNQGWTGLLSLTESYTEAAPFENSLVLVSYSAIANATTLQTFHLPVSPYERWATEQLPAGAPENGDGDQDGLTNFDEYALGLNPAHPDAAPRLELKVANPASAEFTFPLTTPRSDVRYWIDATDDFKGWVPALMFPRTTLDTAGSPRRFFRLRAERIHY